MINGIYVFYTLSEFLVYDNSKSHKLSLEALQYMLWKIVWKKQTLFWVRTAHFCVFLNPLQIFVPRV